MLIYLSNRDPGVAQMVARLNGVQEAASSNLVTRTSKTQSVRKSTLRFFYCQRRTSGLLQYNQGRKAARSGVSAAGGRSFESSHSDHVVAKYALRPRSFL